MSKSLSRIVALEEISIWNTNDVVLLLQKNGLDDCCKAVLKRQIDGDEFLHLTEGKLALWKSDLTRPLTWSLWRFVAEVKEHPEKYVMEKTATNKQSEELMSDSGSWGTDFEDDAEDDDDGDDEDSGVSQPIPNPPNNNRRDQESNSPNGQSTSRNFEFRHSLMIFRENERTSVTRKNSNSPVKRNRATRSVRKLTEGTYTNSEKANEEDPEDDTTYANCSTSEIPVTTKSKNVSSLHEKGEKTLAEQLKEQLKLRNARKTTTERINDATKAPAMLEKSSLDKKPQKSFLHDIVPSLHQQVISEKFSFADPTGMNVSEKVQRLEREETDLPRPPPLTIRNFDLVANLPTRTQESEDEYEPFDEQIIEQNKRLSLARVDSKQSLSSARQSSLESIYKVPSTSSQERQDEGYEIYESITEPPEDNVYYLQPIEKDKVMRKTPPLLPAKPVISPSPKFRRSGIENKNERSPDKKSATLPHSGSSATFAAELRATRPLPPPPDKQSYMDAPWFHNVTREQATALIKERKSMLSVHLEETGAKCAYGNTQNGYFLLRPSTSHPNNPLALVLWFKDRVYNVPVRKRPDNRYALGSAKVNEQSFASVEEIVRFHSREELVLHSGGVEAGTTKLTDTPPK